MFLKYLFITCVSCLIFRSLYDFGVSRIKCTDERETGLDVSRIEVYFTNYATDGIERSAFIGNAAATILATGNLTNNQCVDIFVNGFNNEFTHKSYATVRRILSQAECNGINTFLIFIHHYEYTKGSNNSIANLLAYRRAVKFTKSIGQAIGNMIIELFESRKVDPSNLNIIGFSLGGHIAGYAGAYVKRESRYSVARIDGTDVAGPCFTDCPNEHLHSGQADLVVAYHCTNVLGSALDLSDYDFYSNDGKNQKGCPKDAGFGKKGALCSHYACIGIALYPTIKDDIWNATKCRSYDEYRDGNCTGNENTLAGYRVNPTGSKGRYFFNSSDFDCIYVIIH